MSRGQVEPCRKTSEASAILLHIGNRRSGNELGTLTAEQIRVGDHEIFDAAFFRQRSEVLRHGCLLGVSDILGFIGFLKERSEVLRHKRFPGFSEVSFYVLKNDGL